MYHPAKLRDMNGYLSIALVISFLLLSGCMSEKTDATPSPNPMIYPSEKTPVPTILTLSTPTLTQTVERNWEREFLDAAELCYNKTPVIANISTHEAFVLCMQKTPEPTSVCAKSYKHNALRYTNDDGTSAGYQRITHNTRLFREAFYKNLSYNPIRQMFEPCT